MKYPYLSEKKCKNCECNLIIKRSRDKNNDFCSTSCVGKFRSKEIETTNCKYCNIEFIKSNKTKNFFCSSNCANKSRKVYYHRSCLFCSKEFTIHNIAEIKRGGGKYCSNECSSRKYILNERYFEEIDSQNKAYILGFIFADGCVSKKKYELIIKLHNQDTNILEDIKKELSTNTPIKTLTNYKNHQSCLRISSKKICSDLIKLGVTPSKTFTIEFPELKPELVKHFIRGYFDGDGCLYNGGRDKKSNIYNIFTASEKFKNSIIECLNLIGINTRCYYRNNGYSINIVRYKDTYNFYNYLYNDSEMFLKRKKDKFILKDLSQ
jgi:intein/homing endonuclease